MDYVSCLLPGGYTDQDSWLHRYVEFTPLGGREEAFVTEIANHPQPHQVTAILIRCVQRIGDIQPVPEQTIRGLLVSDRQYLLLKLWEATYGSQIQVTIVCSSPECGSKIEVNFSMKDIPIKESVDKGPVYEMKLSTDAAYVSESGETFQKVCFRLPTGADQEALAQLLKKNEAQAAAHLMMRCIRSIGSLENPTEEQIARFTPLACSEIEKRMLDLAPQVDLTMHGNCPECGRQFATPFDLESFFLGQINISLELLYREVHYLAFHYHWSEREIMDMPRPKRRKYIEILSQEIERMNEAV
jgi:hypothetical protein